MFGQRLDLQLGNVRLLFHQVRAGVDVPFPAALAGQTHAKEHAADYQQQKKAAHDEANAQAAVDVRGPFEIDSHWIGSIDLGERADAWGLLQEGTASTPSI